jgi:hypothetical protein
MSTNISEEAKLAIANRAQVKARARLDRDGCHTNAALRRRVLLLAAERNLPPAEYAKLLHKRVMTGSILDFCKKHDVSLDWLMHGDLKGLQRMKKFVALVAPKKVFSSDELLAQMALLDPAGRKIVTDYINQLIAQRDDPNA